MIFNVHDAMTCFMTTFYRFPWSFVAFFRLTPPLPFYVIISCSFIILITAVTHTFHLLHLVYSPYLNLRIRDVYSCVFRP